MPDETLPQRTLKTTFWLVTFFTLVFAVRGQLPIAFGLALGGALGLFSLWSLTFAIPKLFSSPSPIAKFKLALLTLSKLPIYAISLYFAMASPVFSPFSVFVGVALIPAVLVLKVVGFKAIQNTNDAAGDETCRTNPAISN
jgi:hypothetical protein